MSSNQSKITSFLAQETLSMSLVEVYPYTYRSVPSIHGHSHQSSQSMSSQSKNGCQVRVLHVLKFLQGQWCMYQNLEGIVFVFFLILCRDFLLPVNSRCFENLYKTIKLIYLQNIYIYILLSCQYLNKTFLNIINGHLNHKSFPVAPKVYVTVFDESIKITCFHTFRLNDQNTSMVGRLFTDKFMLKTGKCTAWVKGINTLNHYVMLIFHNCSFLVTS